MQVIDTKLPGVVILEPRVFADDRGWFMETFNEAAFRARGLPASFVQDNHSQSARGVLRGLHYQEPNPQGKLVRCTRGAIFDVAVDIRTGSSTFGQWVGVELTDENKRMLWIPEGFAHGFCAVSELADVVYKCTTLWEGKHDRSLRWNDPQIGISWPVSDPRLSEKDAAAPTLADAPILPRFPA
ncbi:MAG TPA: dTDP-4-dehydrorhamnose 3,5-epimerase [Thermoanaerobaculia bacterium]